jgi:hypothetical protein
VPLILEARKEGWLILKDVETDSGKRLMDELIAFGLGVGESASIA